MKKLSFILIVLVALLMISCATKAPVEAVEIKQAEAAPVAAVPAGCKYAGEYEVITYSQDDPEHKQPIYFEEFIVEADGTLHGATEGSGLTGFEGTVDANGVITATYTRLGGTMVGQFDGNGNVTGTSSIRGRVSDFSGHIL